MPTALTSPDADTVWTRPPTSGVHIADMGARPWLATAKPGLWTKPLREDHAKGEFLGLVRFDPFVRSGLHQHQGVATSFVIDGGLSDYFGSVGLHQMGINLKGSTHDAIAYQNTVLVSRLEGPVTYPPTADISGVHAGSVHGEFVNAAPDVPPEVNVSVDTLPAQATGIPGASRQGVFDYAGTGSHHRLLQLTLRPHTELEFKAGGLTDFWVRGGELQVNGQTAYANCFVMCASGAHVHIASPFGALLLVWAEGADSSAGNLFGF